MAMLVPHQLPRTHRDICYYIRRMVLELKLEGAAYPEPRGQHLYPGMILAHSDKEYKHTLGYIRNDLYIAYGCDRDVDEEGDTDT
jgi:hypothetical protein